MLSPHRILVVDDERNLRVSLTLIFERAGYSVSAAADAHEALDFLQAGAFDLVFLDLKMPDMDGLTLLRGIRNIYPDLPVLILTAHATLESAIEAVREGARDYLLKPVDPPQILARVREIIAQQERPSRRREIVGQLEQLVAELRQFDPHASSAAAAQSGPPPSPQRILRCGPFTLNMDARHARRADGFIKLSPTTFDYLATLIRHAPNPVSYRTLVLESQGYDLSQVEAQEMARWHVHELRKALEPDKHHPRYVLTVRGTGYRFSPE